MALCMSSKRALAKNVISYECERRRGAGLGMCECNATVKLNAADLSVVGYLYEHLKGIAHNISF